jgi:hypothetical protein
MEGEEVGRRRRRGFAGVESGWRTSVGGDKRNKLAQAGSGVRREPVCTKAGRVWGDSRRTRDETLARIRCAQYVGI